jgi:hypothetical protein
MKRPMRRRSTTAAAAAAQQPVPAARPRPQPPRKRARRLGPRARRAARLATRVGAPRRQRDAGGRGGAVQGAERDGGVVVALLAVGFKVRQDGMALRQLLRVGEEEGSEQDLRRGAGAQDCACNR